MTRLKIPPFIVTLGALGIYRGIALLITGGNGVVSLPEGFGKLAAGTVLKIPVPLLIVIAIALIIHFLLSSTRLGRYCYAIGSNLEAARYAGIKVAQYQISFYSILGILTGLAGALVASRLLNGVPTEGEGIELNVIAAVVIGGGSLSGGQGTVVGYNHRLSDYGSLSKRCESIRNFALYSKNCHRNRDRNGCHLR